MLSAGERDFYTVTKHKVLSKLRPGYNIDRVEKSKYHPLANSVAAVVVVVYANYLLTCLI